MGPTKASNHHGLGAGIVEASVVMSAVKPPLKVWSTCSFKQASRCSEDPETQAVVR